MIQTITLIEPTTYNIKAVPPLKTIQGHWAVVILCDNLWSHFALSQYKANTLKAVEDLAQEHPMIDYTLPLPITLLFTDLGVYTRSAVSDELIKLYL